MPSCVLTRRYSFEVPNGWKNEVVGKVCTTGVTCTLWSLWLSTPPAPQVEKGMQGIDTRVTNPKGKGAHEFIHPASAPASPRAVLTCWVGCAGQQAFVVTFGRAGEDNKKFKLGDADLTLQGFAGADYDLQVWCLSMCSSHGLVTVRGLQLEPAHSAFTAERADHGHRQEELRQGG